MLRSEWLKLKGYVPFWVLMAIYPLCIGGTVAVSMKFGTMAGSSIPAGQLPDFFGYPLIWQTVAYIASWLQFFPALVVILTMTNEFSFRTHRQNILDGWSRSQFCLAKLMVVCLVVLYATLIVAGVSLLAGAVGGHAPTTEGLVQVALFALQTLVYQLFALLTAVLLRRAALALAAFSIYTAMLEKIPALMLDSKIGGGGYYLPLQSANYLVRYPFDVPHLPGYIPPPALSVLSGVAGVYALLMAGLVWLKLGRSDL